MKRFLQKCLHWILTYIPISISIRLTRKITLLYDMAGYGDTFMVAAVAREIKKKYPFATISVNRTKRDLLINNPYIDKIGDCYCGINLNYHTAKYNAKEENNYTLIQVMGRNVGVKNPAPYVDIFLTDDEKAYGQRETAYFKRPIITIHTTSGDFDNGRKTWPLNYWNQLLKDLDNKYTVLQLGNSGEIPITGAQNYLGKQSFRCSLALIEFADLHIGIVSSLMHGAAAVGTPAIIIFGGFERYALHKYNTVDPIESEIDCSPCITFDALQTQCVRTTECMQLVTPAMVSQRVYDWEKNWKQK